jgi:hypothetical protein
MKASASNWGKAYGGRRTKEFDVELDLDYEGVSRLFKLKFQRDVSNTATPEEGNVESMFVKLTREAAQLLAVRLKEWFVIRHTCPNSDRTSHYVECSLCAEKVKAEHDLWEKAAKSRMAPP